MTKSMRPPAKPENAPRTVPNDIEMPTIAKPTLTDVRARYAIYPRGSLPYPADAPAPRARVLTPGWNAQPGRHPQGSPAGMAVARDGSIWIADDRAGAILRIARAN